jgi:hypothetical protein
MPSFPALHSRTDNEKAAPPDRQEDGRTTKSRE